MEKHQAYTLPGGLFLVAIGLIIRYATGRRRFNRRGIGGLQQFPTYVSFILTVMIERLIHFIGTIVLCAGLLLLAIAGFNHLKI